MAASPSGTVCGSTSTSRPVSKATVNARAHFAVRLRFRATGAEKSNAVSPS